MLKRIRQQFYDSDEIDWEHLPFAGNALWALLLPVMAEQFLNSFMGMADTMMISRVGSAAISAVSLVDAINVLIIMVFNAMAAGGTILCSQYIGKQDLEDSNQAAQQLTLAVAAISVVLMTVCLLLNDPILRLTFGSIEDDVMAYSRQYFYLTALSFPFLALAQAGSAFFRAGGNSRFPMTVSVISNGLNIFGNAVFIFVFHWEVFGAALSTLLSRIFLCIVVFWFLRKPRQPIVLTGYHKIRPDFRMIRKILRVGVPSGIENGMFQFGKLAIQSSVSTLGTTAIAAEAMAVILENLNGMAGLGIGVGMMTVVGQCIGASKVQEARYYIWKLSWYAEIAVLISCAGLLALTKPILWLAGMEAESAAMCLFMMTVISILKPIVWVPAFLPGYGLRAAGDVKFSMLVSTCTMWMCRVTLATILIRLCGFGPIGVWIGQISDWAIRSIIFTLRYHGHKWERLKVT